MGMSLPTTHRWDRLATAGGFDPGSLFQRPRIAEEGSRRRNAPVIERTFDVEPGLTVPEPGLAHKDDVLLAAEAFGGPVEREAPRSFTRCAAGR